MRVNEFPTKLINRANVKPIAERPAEANNRTELGHFEGDLILGSDGFHLITLVDRKSRMSYSKKIKGKSAKNLNKEMKKLLLSLGVLVKSITLDNGTEFSRIGNLAKELNFIVYRADPYKSQQRGSNENFNGLLRREYPKGTRFGNIHEEEINLTIFKINHMKRKMFGWKSAIEMNSSK